MTMTVQQLIDELMKIEDKTQKCYISRPYESDSAIETLEINLIEKTTFGIVFDSE